MSKVKKKVSNSFKKIICNNVKSSTKEVGGTSELFIEGWANKNIVDSVGDRMNPLGMVLDKFMVNPMVLFNHDRDKPIGEAVEVKALDEGIWCKIRIMKSTNDFVQFVRDAIMDNILKTFSISFEPVDGDYDKVTGEYVYNKYILNEISVVTLPCNADSVFGLAKTLDPLVRRKSYDEAKRFCSGLQGKKELSDVMAHLVRASAYAQDKAPEEVLTAIVEMSGMTLEEVRTVINEGGELPEQLVSAINQTLSTDIVSLMGTVGTTPDEDPKEPMDEEEDKKEEGAEGEDCKEGDTEEPKEDGGDAFQACVESKLPQLISEGKPQDQAMAIAISMCQEEGKCSLEYLTKERLESFKNFAAKIEKEEPITTPTSPPAGDVSQPEASDFDMLRTIVSLMGEMNTNIRELRGELNTFMPQLQTITDSLQGPGENELQGSSVSADPEPKEAPSKEVLKYRERIDKLLKGLGH